MNAIANPGTVGGRPAPWSCGGARVARPGSRMREAFPVDVLRRLLLAGLLAAPAAALAALAFESGGYYPGTTALAALAALGALAAWVLLAPNALEGLGRSGAIVLALLAAFAGWTLISGTWSHAPGTALVEFDRALLYLAVFALFALAGRTGARVRALIAILAAAALVVAIIGLLAWLLPTQVHVAASFERRRMSYPTGYWNTTGLLAGLGLVWSLHLASASREHPGLRIAGAAAIAPLAAVIGYTASRGALVATAAGVVVYVLVTRSRAVLIGLMACIPPAIGAAIIVYRSPELANYLVLITPAATRQGRHALWALLLCVAGAAMLRAWLLRLDQRIAEIDFPVPSRRLRLQAGAGALVVLVIAAIAFGLPGHARHAYHQFANPSTGGLYGESRITSLNNDGRIQLWHVALIRGFVPHPLWGSGAGSYADLWNRYRPNSSDAQVATSLYIGTLGDLGLVGAALLFTALVMIVVALVRHARRPSAEGAAWAGLLAGAAVWLVFVAADWAWNMPSCTIWLLAVGGLAVSRSVDSGGGGAVSPWRARPRVTWAVRIAIAGAAVALALVPRALERSDAHLNSAIADLQRDDCAGAQSQAAASRAAVSQRPEPYMVLAFCAARQDRNAAALRYADSAVARDPDNWEVYYTRGLVQAAAGQAPQAALHAALVRDPLGSYAREAATRLDRAPAGARRPVALGLPIPLAVELCGGPTQADQVAPCGNPSLPTLGPGPPVPTTRP